MSSLGIPADQLAAFDHRLSPPALLKVDTAIEDPISLPVELISGVDPLRVI